MKQQVIVIPVDIKGKAYEELVGANLRGDRGEFFTPRNVMHMTVEMLEPHEDEKVLDPASGTGGFLVSAMNKVIEQLELKLKKENRRPKLEWSDNEKRIFQERIRDKNDRTRWTITKRFQSSVPPEQLFIDRLGSSMISLRQGKK